MRKREITTVSGTLPLPDDVSEVSICCHSDTPVSLDSIFLTWTLSLILQGAVEIATVVKSLVDGYNREDE